MIENNICVDGALFQWEMNGWTTNTALWKEIYDKTVSGYESIVNLPAWKGKRGMQVHPKDLADSEGRVMCGNVFKRNVMSWTDPKAKVMRLAEFNPTRNSVDDNLYWHAGLPIESWLESRMGKALSGNLVANGSFTASEPGKMPAGWNWQIRPRPNASAEVVAIDGGKCLRIDAAFVAEKPSNNYPVVVGGELELKPGTVYRLRARMRAEVETEQASLMVECWNGPLDGRKGHFWCSNPNKARLTRQWKTIEFPVNVPKAGQPDWDDRMKIYKVRIDWRAPSGSVYIDDVVLEEAERLDSWASWKADGCDQHSVIANPMFRNAAKDDYRLKKTSPAWALGFKPIPVEKIGPYKSPLRASWPIVEAPGARERKPGAF